MKKIASILGGLALLSVSYGVASAATLEELQAQLQSIRAQIAALQAQDGSAASWVIDRAFPPPQWTELSHLVLSPRDEASRF
jgi:type II secretory pathway pseudopilin PulG